MVKKSNLNTAPTSGAVKRIVKDVLDSRVEFKATGTTSATATVTAGAVTYVTGTAQDDTINGRTGDVIRPRKLTGRWWITADADVPTQSRLIVFQDLQCNGTTPGVTDVLNSASASSMVNYINVVQQKRIKILYDHTVALRIGGPGAAHFEISVPLKGNINYLGTSAAIGSAGKGSLFYLAISSSADEPQTIDMRVTYTDM